LALPNAPGAHAPSPARRVPISPRWRWGRAGGQPPQPAGRLRRSSAKPRPFIPVPRPSATRPGQPVWRPSPWLRTWFGSIARTRPSTTASPAGAGGGTWRVLPIHQNKLHWIITMGKVCTVAPTAERGGCSGDRAQGAATASYTDN
jgi:hypothetical protein